MDSAERIVTPLQPHSLLETRSGVRVALLRLIVGNWLILTCVVLLAASCLGTSLMAWQTAVELRSGRQLAIVDPAGDLHLSPIRLMQEETQVFATLAKYAALGSMTLSPTGPDYPELMRALHTPKLQGEIAKHAADHAPERRERDLYQSIRGLRWEKLAGTRGPSGEPIVVIAVDGFLLEAGEAGGFAVRQAFPFRLVLGFAPNPRWGEAMQWPYLVVARRLTVERTGGLPAGELPAS